MSKKILIVDDEEHIREILSEFLSEQGFSVMEASDGEFAINLFKEHQFDLVITDIRMPRMNGLELLSAVKSHDKQNPVVLMTGYDLSNNEIANCQFQADGYVLKPFNLKQLLAYVHDLVK